jgi:hypothetical protein
MLALQNCYAVHFLSIYAYSHLPDGVTTTYRVRLIAGLNPEMVGVPVPDHRSEHSLRRCFRRFQSATFAFKLAYSNTQVEHCHARTPLTPAKLKSFHSCLPCCSLGDLAGLKHAYESIQSHAYYLSTIQLTIYSRKWRAKCVKARDGTGGATGDPCGVR